jgi:hypothetical protein
MDRWQRAIQGRGPSQFLQSQIRLAAQELTKSLALSGDFAGLEPATMIAWADVAALSPPLQKFLDHAQRYFKAAGNLLAGPFLLIVRSQNSFPQIQRDCSHGQIISPATQDGYDFI